MLPLFGRLWLFVCSRSFGFVSLCRCFSVGWLVNVRVLNYLHLIDCTENTIYFDGDRWIPLWHPPFDSQSQQTNTDKQNKLKHAPKTVRDQITFNSFLFVHSFNSFTFEHGISSGTLLLLFFSLLFSSWWIDAVIFPAQRQTNSQSKLCLTIKTIMRPIKFEKFQHTHKIKLNNLHLIVYSI